MADKKKHKKPRTIITHRHDGKNGAPDTFHHEHRFDGGEDEKFAGTSADLDDVKQHMEDHFGGEAEAAAPPAAAPAPGAAPEMPGGE